MHRDRAAGVVWDDEQGSAFVSIFFPFLRPRRGFGCAVGFDYLGVLIVCRCCIVKGFGCAGLHEELADGCGTEEELRRQVCVTD